MDSRPAGFPSTLWSAIRDAGHADPAQRREALERLAERYWKPAYWYLRLTGGRSDADALDLTQAFFVHLIESDFLAKADASRGRFRHFLKRSLHNFAADRARIDGAVQRGGRALKLSIERAAESKEQEAEILAAGAEQGPDRVFERSWCASVIEAATRELKRRLEAGGRGAFFESFRQHDQAGDDVSYRDVATRQGVSEDEVRNHLRVARELFRQCVMDELRETVESAAELQEELNELFAWLK